MKLQHLAWCLAVIWISTTCPAAPSAEPTGTQSPTTREIAAAAIKGTVTIKVQTSDGGLRSGCGFVIDPGGTIITNVHVVDGVIVKAR